MFQIGSCGRSLPTPGVSVDPQPLHGLPNSRITDDPAKFKTQFVPDLTVSHHWMVGMDVQDIVIQYLVCFLVLVQSACSFQPLIVTAAGNTVDFAQFADRVFVCLSLNFSIHLLDHLFRASPPFRSFSFFRRSTSASFLTSSRFSSSI